LIDQEAFDRHVANHFIWNFGANVMDLAFYTLAMSFVSTSTIMPLLVSRLTTSKLAIGLVPAIFSLGFLLPQLLTANYAERLQYKKGFVMLVSGPGERMPYLVIGLLLLLLNGALPDLTLVLFFLLVATSAVSAGVTNPAWSDLVAKVIPVRKRGLWSGTAFGFGALMGVLGAWIAGSILASEPFARNFAYCFLLSSGAQVFSWIGLALNREPPGLSVKPHVSLLDYLRRLPAVLRADRNFTRYLASRSCANLGNMAIGFLMVYGVERFAFGGREVGYLTATLAASQAVTNLFWGILGDRAGHKLVLAGAAFCALGATLLALAAGSPLTFYMAFAFLGASASADSVGGMNIALEFGTAADRPTYIGLANTLLAPARSLAPILGGALATVAGYPSMFSVACVLAGLGGLMMVGWVKEPRHLGAMGVAVAE
jgi:MFS family permease